MARIMQVSGLAVALVISLCALSQAAAPGPIGSILPALAGTAGDVPGKDAPRPDWQAGRPDERMMDHARVVLQAIREPKAKDNAEIRKLVDEIIAGRRQVLQDEIARVDALEKAVQASRGDDKAAVLSAKEAFQAAADKVRQSEGQLMQNVRELRNKLRDLGKEDRVERKESSTDKPAGEGTP